MKITKSIIFTVVSAVVLCLSVAYVSFASGFVEYNNDQGFIVYSLFDDPNQQLQLLADSLTSSNQVVTRFVGDKSIKFTIDSNNNDSDEVFAVNAGTINMITVSKDSDLIFARDVVLSADHINLPNNRGILLDSGRIHFKNSTGVVGVSINDILISNSIADRPSVPSQGIFSKSNVWIGSDSSVGVIPSSSYKLNINGSVNTDTEICIAGACWTSLTPTDIFNNKAKYSTTSSRTMDDVLQFGNNNEVLASGYKYADISPVNHDHVTGDLGAIIINSDLAETAGIVRSKLATCSKAAKNLYQINNLLDRNPSNCPAGGDGRKLDADTEGGVDACLTFDTFDACIN